MTGRKDNYERLLPENPVLDRLPHTSGPGLARELDNHPDPRRYTRRNCLEGHTSRGRLRTRGHTHCLRLLTSGVQEQATISRGRAEVPRIDPNSLTGLTSPHSTLLTK